MNRAIWLDKDCNIELREIHETYKPGKGEVLVEVNYSGINPADIAHGTLGFKDYPAGYDFAGTVIEAGEGMNSKYNVGDKIIGLGAPELHKPIQYGTHQKYHVARHAILHVPENVSMAEAACMPVICFTAADGLFSQLKIPFEPSAEPKADPIPLLIWGGAGAVGSSAIQMAKAVGCYPILTTASPKHHEQLLSLGATECFDYRDDKVVEQIQVAVKSYGKKPLEHVFDCVGAKSTPSSATLCESCCANGGKGVKFTCVVPPTDGKDHQDWMRTFAVRNADVDFILPNGIKLIHKAHPEWQAINTKAVQWCLDNYGKGFYIPNVKVVKGGEAGIEKMRLVREGKASMEKFVIEHPL